MTPLAGCGKLSCAMFFVFSKLIQPILWPLNQALFALLAGFVLLRLRKEKAARVLFAAAFSVLFVSSLPIVAHRLARGLESDYPVLSSIDAPKADAIVVLGGTVSNRIPPRKEVQEISGSRLVPAAWLFKAGKAQKIIVSSGTDYSQADGSRRAESQDMADFLVALGVPSKSIIQESRSRNTYENAKYTAELVKDSAMKSILLVTSAFHMPRSVAMFKKFGVTNVVPFPSDHRITNTGVRAGDFLPEIGALAITTASIKEYVGRLVYR